MAKEDFYKLLDVKKNASDIELKKSYRRMAMKYHPDRNKDNQNLAEKKFKQIKEAYDVLSDSKKRAVYDQFGHAGVEQSAAGSNSGGFGAENFSDVFGDVFGDIFGGSGRKPGNKNKSGSDLQYNLSLTLEEAIGGTEENIRVPTFVACKTCHGSGAKKDSSIIACNTCRGQGQIRMQQGFFSVQQTCSTCNGSGKQIKDYCNKCKGQGRIQEYKTLLVKVPAGVDNGDNIRLSREGEAGVNGGVSGDLYIQIQVKKHALFTRDGTNLYCEVPISFPTACLGGELEVPTLNGKVKLKIHTETQTGKLFRLRGKGVKPVRGGSVGDLLCRVQIETPVCLTKNQQELLNNFNDSITADKGKHHSPQAHNWKDGVKNFFDKLTG